MRRTIQASNIDVYAQPETALRYIQASGLTPTEEMIIGSHFPAPPARVLDIGVGAGRTAAQLVARGYEVIGIEPAEPLLRAAVASVPRADIRLMSAARLDFPDRSFDAALFSFSGLSHVHPRSDRLAVYDEVRRVLRPGGCFYYSSHNITGRWLRNRANARRQLRQLIRHDVRNPINLLQGYWWYRDGDSNLMLYSRGPRVHIRRLRRAGFRVEGVYGVEHSGDQRIVRLSSDRVTARAANSDDRIEDVNVLKLTIGYHHVHYVARVPHASRP